MSHEQLSLIKHAQRLEREVRDALMVELRKAGCPWSHYRVLARLPKGGGFISQAALALEMAVDPSGLVRVLDELEGRGLVERRASLVDRRKKEVHITDRGRELWTEWAPIEGRVLDIARGALEPGEEAVLSELLYRVSNRLKEFKRGSGLDEEGLLGLVTDPSCEEVR